MNEVEQRGADERHERFTNSRRRHLLMVTNHGVHEWRVVPGLTDTGGQNVYVNQFTEALLAQGYRVTIVNRGGYPHPQTGQVQRGMVYHDSGHARIMYLEDGCDRFVRKEDMNEQLPRLCEDLTTRLKQEGTPCELIISHYWDGCKLAVMFNETNEHRMPHVWVPHSLGALKKRNMDPSTWAGLRIDERIAHERELLNAVDGTVATSSAIRDTFQNDYGHKARYFLPPCVDEERYRPRPPEEVEPIWSFLSVQSGLAEAELKKRKLVTEISRTDGTKRKDVLIKAFARVRKDVPEAMLLVSIDQRAGDLYESLTRLIGELGLRDDVVVLGSVWDQLPLLYNVTDVFCTPSVMEGFGMSAQEAAATGKPVIASNLVPFVCEYLLGPTPQRVTWDHDPSKDLLLGSAGIVVPADFIEGFANAVVRLLRDDERRRAMGAEALKITVPYFTWGHMAASLMSDLGFSGDRGTKRRSHEATKEIPCVAPSLCRSVAFSQREDGVVDRASLADTLIETWARQGRDGFLLTDPRCTDIPTREVVDSRTGVSYRFRWMPHRELRGDVAELERRGILNAERDEGRLFRDHRDPSGRHCFLCADNIAECHPLEVLVPVELAGRSYFAGANFAWIEENHFTVMSAEHTDQVYARHVMEALLDLHRKSAQRFRVLYNGPGAGATIPWHLHFQITTQPLPIEHLKPDCEAEYPTTVHRLALNEDGLDRAHAVVEEWLARDPANHSVNLLAAAPNGDTCLYVFPRDQRRASASEKGLVGGFEVAGDFVISAPQEQATFDGASAAAARAILTQIRPSV